jgi:hypothetical protein
MKPTEHNRLHLVLEDLGLSFPSDGEAMLAYRADRHAVTARFHADHDLPLVYEPDVGPELGCFFLTVGAALRAARRLALAVLAAHEGDELAALAVTLLAELGGRGL